MTRRDTRPRSGVTLTEILISILILGVGLISLATLFPIGLIRLRTAQRLTRSTYLAESAIDELKTRNLLVKSSFLNTFTSPYVAGGYYYDPFVQDTPSYGAASYTVANGVTTYHGVQASIAPGLPVAYDPLWWNVTGTIYNNNNVVNAADEGRFGSGINFLRSNGNGAPSANGLQRLNNLFGSTSGTQVYSQLNMSVAQQQLNYAVALEAFISPEDVVFQEPKGQGYLNPLGGLAITNPSPVVPDLSQVQNSAMLLPSTVHVYPPQNDWHFTWMATGQQRDVTNGTMFDLNIVVHENRVFGLDTINGTTYQPSGETVVEAVWGYGSGITSISAITGTGLSTTEGYATSAKRAVLLLWPATQPDPDVRVGQWIADVTYERDYNTAGTRFSFGNGNNNPRIPAPFSPAQRCFWYQVAKRTDPGPATTSVQAFAGANYRQMTVWTSVDLNAQSMLTVGSQGTPVNVEAALIAPTVVNVIPRQVYTR